MDDLRYIVMALDIIANELMIRAAMVEFVNSGVYDPRKIAEDLRDSAIVLRRIASKLRDRLGSSARSPRRGAGREIRIYVGSEDIEVMVEENGSYYDDKVLARGEVDELVEYIKKVVEELVRG